MNIKQRSWDALLFPALLMLASAAEVRGETTILLAGVPQGIDVKRDAGVEYGAAQTGNGTLLTSVFANSSSQKPFLFFGGRCEISDGPVQVPQRWGYVFAGGGRPSIQNEDAVNTGPAPRIIQTTPRVAFNGTTITAATSGASATITIGGSTGWTVTSADVGRTLEIPASPPANWMAVWYVVTSVDAGANRWTLDRACSTATATGLVGLATGTLEEGPPDDDALNGVLVVFTNDSDPDHIKKAIGLVRDYDGSSRTITLVTDPGVFTIAHGDKVDVIATSATAALGLGSTP